MILVWVGVTKTRLTRNGKVMLFFIDRKEQKIQSPEFSRYDEDSGC